MEETKQYQSYTPTAEDKKIMSMVDTRFSAMKTHRSQEDVKRPTYQKMIDAVFTPYSDERSASTVPLASSIIELFLADAIKLQTEYKFKPLTSKNQAAATALKYAWDFDWRHKNRKKVFIEDEYIAAGFGTSIIYTGYESCEKTQSNPMVGDDGTLTREEEIYKDEGIIVENVKLDDFYIDNQAIKGIEDATDCILRQWVSYEIFEGFEGNNQYFNVGKVSPKSYNTGDEKIVAVGNRNQNGEFVELIHYWNVKKDKYIVIANDVLVRDQPMISTIDGKKALPFVIRNLGKKNYSIYGRGLCEPLLMFNSEINNLREMLLDSIRRSNQPTIAIGNGLSFDGRQISFQNEVLTFTGDLNSNFQQIAGNPPNQAIFSYLERIYKDIAVFVGIDINNIIGESQQTAFQTEVQRAAAQKRVNVYFMNRDLAMERFANLHKDNLLLWTPIKGDDGKYPEYESEDEKLSNTKNPRFKKAKGKHTFEMSPDLLRKEIYVDVYTNINAPTINAVDRQQKIEFVNSLGTMSQSIMMAKQAGLDLETITPIKQLFLDLAMDHNITVSEGGNESEDVKKGVDELIQSLSNTNPNELPSNIQGGAETPQTSQEQGAGAGGGGVPIV